MGRLLGRRSMLTRGTGPGGIRGRAATTPGPNGCDMACLRALKTTGRSNGVEISILSVVKLKSKSCCYLRGMAFFDNDSRKTSW